jgi:type I restriction enzyme S subunit
MIKATEYCKNVFDGTHDSPKPVEKGYRLLTSKNIMSGYLDKTDSYFISEEDYIAINKRSKVYKWDILFSMIGTVGNVCIITDDNIDFAIKNMGVFSCRDEYEAKWLYFYLQSPYIRKINENYLNGAIQKFLPLGRLRELEIVPFDNEKKKIVDLLWSIEEKLRKNNLINNELESMAKTLYDYWFLQFDFPNEQGKPYKSSGGRTVWNEELKIEIPEGWRVSKIGNILEEANKSKIQVNDAKEKGKYPFFTSGEKILCYDDYFVNGFNLFLNTGGNPDIKAYMGKCAYSTDTWCVSAKEYSYILFYYLLKLMPQFEQLFFAGSGLKHLQKDSLKNQYILLPDEKVLRNFNNICELIWKKITNCLIENQELTSQRDFLLPLLMNGQVTFKE